MVDGRSQRKNKVVRFLDHLSIDRKNNLEKLIQKAKRLEMEGFEQIAWGDSTWEVTRGRLTKLTGKQSSPRSFYFRFSPKLGAHQLTDEWADVAKALFSLRFHRDHQNAANQRTFITAIGYIAHAADNLNLSLERLTPEALDAACLQISKDYEPTTAYNLHKAIGEFAGHCDANALCRIAFKYRYSKMKRPDSAGGQGYKRLDDPEALKTVGDKFIEPLVFKILGELFQNVPQDHKYRFYVLFLTLLACTGRRFSEISLLPHQNVKENKDGDFYVEFFPRKASQGDLFTPLRKLDLFGDILEIVKETLDELNELCLSARETAAQMYFTNGPDIKFLAHIDDSARLYKKDLVDLGVTPSALDTTGWIRKNNLAFADYEKLTEQNKIPNNPFYYTTKSGVIAYCQRDFNENFNITIHIDQTGKKYYLKDLLLVRYQGLSTGSYSRWIATQCTHSMMTTFLRYFPELAQEYASSSIEVDFTCQHFRHTLNTLLDEGGLSDLLQTEWFGRSNPRDTKAYQHTSREKRALMLREDIKNGLAGGKINDIIKTVSVTIQDAVLKSRIQAVHDVGTGICIHNFSQLPCERHLQCSAECDDYVWAKGDKGRMEELKRQFALTSLARNTAEEKSKTAKPGKSGDWLTHNDKKLKTLSIQLKDNGINDFDPKAYLEGMES